MAVRTTFPGKADLRVPCSQVRKRPAGSAGHWCSRRPALPRALRIEKKNIRRFWSLTRKAAMIRKFLAPVPGQGLIQFLW
jgi:hypothetical protein